MSALSDLAPRLPASAGAGNYRAINKTRNEFLALEVEAADTLWTRMKGLMGRSQENFCIGNGLWIRPSQGIHTFGMAFPIDVLYLDSRGRVLKMYQHLAPFRVAALVPWAHSILELPAGTLARTGTAVGDLVEIQSSQSKRREG